MGTVRGGRSVLLAVALALTAAAVARGDERSQRLVARGQVACASGDLERAEELFAAAVAADPTDAEARQGLELLRARRAAAAPAPTEGGEPSARRWSVRGRAGVAYDSNVALLSHGQPGRRDDAVFLLGAGASVVPVSNPHLQLQLDYDFEQTLHPRLRDFDLRTNRVGGTLSVPITHALSASLYGGVEHYGLGTSQYLLDPFVEPIASYAWTDVGVTQVFYRHGEPDYLSAPFDGVRDGQTNAVGVTQTFQLGDPARRLVLGYVHDDEDPRGGAPNDYRRTSDGGRVGLELPAWWEVTLGLGYAYRRDDYHDPNSVAGFRKARTDDAHGYSVGVVRPLLRGLSLRLDYEGTANLSNIGFFAYRRQIVFLGVEARY